jgi:hypothetical protein
MRTIAVGVIFGVLGAVVTGCAVETAPPQVKPGPCEHTIAYVLSGQHTDTSSCTEPFSPPTIIDKMGARYVSEQPNVGTCKLIDDGVVGFAGMGPASCIFLCDDGGAIVPWQVSYQVGTTNVTVARQTFNADGTYACVWSDEGMLL